MSSKFAASRLVALTASVIREKGGAMLAAAPWLLGVVILTLPFAVHASRYAVPLHQLYLLCALLNVLALAAVTWGWIRKLALDDALSKPIWGGGAGGLKYLALFVLLVVTVVQLLRLTGNIPILIYFSMPNSLSPVRNPTGEALFFALVIAALLVLWIPVMYLCRAMAISLVNVAVSGEYGLRTLREKIRFGRWPLLVALFFLIASAGVTAAAIPRAQYHLSVSSVAFSAAGIVVCIALLAVVVAMSAVAYRGSANH